MPEPGFLKVLRVAALIAVPIGACGSLGLTLYAGRHNNSLVLTLLFAGWAVAPFAAGLWANVGSKRWPVPTRVTLHLLMLVITMGSLVIYEDVAVGHPRAKIAFYFLVVPFASWLLLAVALISGRMSRRTEPRQ